MFHKSRKEKLNLIIIICMEKSRGVNTEVPYMSNKLFEVINVIVSLISRLILLVFLRHEFLDNNVVVYPLLNKIQNTKRFYI